MLHGHGYRERRLLGERAWAAVTIAIYLCAGCGATWRILPRFLARHLWRSWPVVEASAIGPASPAQPRVAERTVRRWRERLRSSARRLVQILATSSSAVLESVVHAIGIDASRGELSAAYSEALGSASGARFADLAAIVHRLEPGVRLV